MSEVNLSLEALGVNMPYSREAEEALLGAVLVKPDAFSDTVDLLKPEMFYTKYTGGVYGEILRLFAAGQPLDIVTVLNAVQDAGVFENEGEAKQYLSHLVETVPTVSNLKVYANIIAEKYIVRQLMNAAGDILQSSGEENDAAMLLESAEQKIYEIRQGRDTGALTPFRTVVTGLYSHLQELNGPNRDKYLGIPTGFSYLDKILTGLGRSDLIILAARPGMGKTSFALNIATNVAKQNIPVAIFSLEMTKDQLVGRILSSEARIDSQAFRTGKLSSQDWTELSHVANDLCKAQIYMDDTSAITVPEMKAKIRRINQDPAKPNIGVIVVDYLQLMNSGKRVENRVQEISDITRSLKNMAKELNVPIIALSQLSRSAEKNGRSDKRPALSDLRDSGSIEQDADIVLFLYREAYYAEEGVETDETIAECIVAKNRHGETSKVMLNWDGAHTRFTSVAYTDE